MRDHVVVAEMTIAARVLEELRRSHHPLDDDELTRRLGVSRRQAVNQVCRGLESAGLLRRYVGPEGKIVNDLDRAVPSPAPGGVTAVATSALDMHLQTAISEVQPDRRAALPGHPVPVTALSAVGFWPLELQVHSLDVDLPCGRGCEWTTLGEVPEAPGLYAFTVEDDHELRVA